MSGYWPAGDLGDDPDGDLDEQQELTDLKQLPPGQSRNQREKMACEHANVEYTCETQEYFSNGMFGLPASNIPLRADIINDKYICIDCGEILSSGYGL